MVFINERYLFHNFSAIEQRGYRIHLQLLMCLHECHSCAGGYSNILFSVEVQNKLTLKEICLWVKLGVIPVAMKVSPEHIALRTDILLKGVIFGDLNSSV